MQPGDNSLRKCGCKCGQEPVVAKLGRKYYIVCPGCNIKTQYQYHDKDAIKNWNKARKLDVSGRIVTWSSKETYTTAIVCAGAY